MNDKKLILGLSAVLLFGAAALGQTYSINRQTIDGGGGTSTGGGFLVSGTIGQPDAGSQTGGSYTLTGGFWSLLSLVQTPGAPPLSIRHTQTNTVVVSWPSPSMGFSLQQSSSLDSPSWTAPAETSTDDGTNRFIIVDPPAGNRFYRLFRP